MSEPDTSRRGDHGSPTKVAIACQGGGSHTAFTAGVLKGLLPEIVPDPSYELVGLSGTSGGAVSAVAAWQGLYVDGTDGVRQTVDAVWSSIAASTPADRLRNAWANWWATLGAQGAPLPEVSPYDLPAASWAQQELRGVIETHVDLRGCRREMAGDRDRPRLVVGTVDVNDGEFETFVDDAITADAILASAAIPTLFPAVEIDGDLHWDGLFSQNPPIDDLTRVPPAEKPEELWVVQINPQSREGRFRSIEDILDRRNELSGNLSLNQELRFLEQVNEWVEAGYLPDDRFERITVRRLPLGRTLSMPSKLDRDAAFIDSLMDDGERRAEKFIEDLRAAE